jgi:hypothetical protein
LLASACSKAERGLLQSLEAGPERIDAFLGQVAGICAGLRSDGRPLTADELPEPFGRDELEQLAQLLA